jgi:uncharacterized protein DUF5317
VATLPILLAIMAGLTVGAARRGRLRAIALTRIRHPEFLAVAIVGSLFVEVSGAGPSGTIALVGLIAGLAFAVVNLHLTGMAIVAVGITANLVPVALNGAMPVRPEALVEAEMITIDELDRVTLDGARELETDSTLLGILGDTYPVRPTGQVVSLGDLIMMVGLADVIANLMLQRRRHRLPPGALATLTSQGWIDDDSIDLDANVSQIDLREDVLADLRHAATIDLVDRPQPASPSSSTSPVHD